MIGHLLQLPIAPVTAVALISGFSLRVMAIRRGWRLPIAKIRERDDLNIVKNSKDTEQS